MKLILTIRQLIGVLLIASPFVAFIAFSLHTIGWYETVCMFLLMLFLVASLGLGWYLLLGP